jgi:hypothetical protein
MGLWNDEDEGAGPRDCRWRHDAWVLVVLPTFSLMTTID